MNNEIDTYIYNNEIIYNHKELDLDFLKVTEDCNQCNPKDDYVCFSCENYQVKEEYPNSKYTDDCFWVIKKGNK
tara:strand:- start:536 stop:757 length:222 start_codon:yes stop_codon:yes gene_type:complete